MINTSGIFEPPVQPAKFFTSGSDPYDPNVLINQKGASFKMTPIFFLVLLLMCDHEKKYAYLVGAGSIFLAYLLIQYLILPDMFSGFIRNALTVVGESGVVGPSTQKVH